MEKLIELLNEYEGQDVWSYDEERGMPYYGWGDDCDYEAYLISKKYGFIKWLVRNDHIDFKKLDTPRFNQLVDNTLDGYLALLMLLAIEDEPINFLCEILK